MSHLLTSSAEGAIGHQVGAKTLPFVGGRWQGEGYEWISLGKSEETGGFC